MSEASRLFNSVKETVGTTTNRLARIPTAAVAGLQHDFDVAAVRYFFGCNPECRRKTFAVLGSGRSVRDGRWDGLSF